MKGIGGGRSDPYSWGTVRVRDIFAVELETMSGYRSEIQSREVLALRVAGKNWG